MATLLEEYLSVVDAVWPDAAPHPDTDIIMCVVVGNTSLQWSIHQGSSQDFCPDFCWRTPPLPQQDLEKDPAELIGAYLPPQVQRTLLAEDRRLDQHFRRFQRVPVIPCYIVSTNEEHLGGLARLLRLVPVKLYRLLPSAFFTTDQGAYEGMGLDRLVAARGAMDQFGLPALVLDGGTALTYTAVDGRGHIIGGGIGCGLRMKLAALAEHTESLPLISASRLQAQTEGRTKPWPRLASNTTDAIVSAVLYETAAHVNGIVTSWLSTAKEQLADAATSGWPVNDAFKIAVTGGDGVLLVDLLQPDHANLIETTLALPPGPWQAVYDRSLILKGMRAVIAKQFAASSPVTSPADQVRQLAVGQRIVKRFDRDLYRGTVAGVERRADLEKDQFWILYDDGDRGTLGIQELYEALYMYVEEGEVSPAAEHPKLEAKVRGATEAALALAEHSDRVKTVVKAKQLALSPRAAKRPSLTPDKTLKRSKKDKTSPVSTAAEAPRAPEDNPTPTPEECEQLAKKLQGRRAAKYFNDGVLYWGRVATYFSKEETANGQTLWNVVYDDGDKEDYEAGDLAILLRQAVELQAEDPENE